MKLLFKSLIVLSVIGLFLFSCQKYTETNPANAQDSELKTGGDQFLQASGSTTQPISGIAQAIIDQNDGSNGIELSGNAATVKKAGNYFIVAAPQALLGSRNATLTCWLQVNGTDVPNSNVLLQTTVDIPFRDVIVSQGVIWLEKDDVVTVMVSGTGSVALEAISPAGQPLVPSIIFTIFKM